MISYNFGNKNTECPHQIRFTNIVGYQTFSATKNTYQLKSVQFDGVGAKFNINDLSGNLNGPSWDEEGLFFTTAPMLMVRNGDIYVQYYYLSDGAVDEESGEYIPGWASATGDPLPAEGVEIEAGTAFWFIDQYSDSSSLTVSGEVVSDATSTATFKTGYTLAACPYPKALAFSEIQFAGLTGPAWDEEGNFFETAPQMLVRDGDIYVQYYYLSDGAVDEESGEYIPGWASATGDPLPNYSEKLISVGTAFWIILPDAGSNVTATFTL